MTKNTRRTRASSWRSENPSSQRPMRRKVGGVAWACGGNHTYNTHTHTEHQSTWNLLCSGSSSGSTTGQTTPSTALRPAPRVCLLVCVCVCVCVYHACIIPTPLLLSCFCRKTISVRVLNREEYDKQCSFCIELQTPLWRRRGWTVYRGFSPSHSVSFAFYSSLPLGRVSPSFSLSLLVSVCCLTNWMTFIRFRWAHNFSHINKYTLHIQ